MTAEHRRLTEADRGKARWRRWGPYLSERQWGTVREDYSADGNAWAIFRTITPAAAPIAGAKTASPASATTSSVSAWRSPCGTNAIRSQGAAVRPDRPGGQSRRGRQGVLLLPRRHADALLSQDALQVPAGGISHTPSSAIENPSWDKLAPEFELIDTGVFDEDRYFDVFVEYAKAAPDDILMVVTVSQSRAGRGAPACAADALVSQYVVMEERRAQAERSRAWTASASRRSTKNWGRSGCTATAAPSCSSARTRRTSASYTARTRRKAISRTGSTASSSRAMRRPSIPRASAPRRRRTTAPNIPAGGSATFRLRLTNARARQSV